MAEFFPTLQPAFMGEWTYSTATAPPPANAQLRTNAAKATKIYVNNISFNGIDASAWLMEMIPGYVIRLQDKNDQTIWSSFTIAAQPVAQSGYVELTTTWIASGKPYVAANVMLSVVSSVVYPAGTAATANVGNVVGSIPVRVRAESTSLKAQSGEVAASGQQITHEYYHAFEGRHLTSPGITLRQWYAGQALVGFISNSVAANLIGKVAEYVFKVADSMIEFEANEAAGKPAAIPRGPAPPPAAPPQSGPTTVSHAEVIALRKKDAGGA